MEVSRAMLRSVDFENRADTYAAMLDALPVIAFMTDTKGAVTYLSRGFERLTGNDVWEVLTHGYEVILHPDDLARVVAAWADARRLRISYRDEYRIRFSDGSYRWVKSQADPVVDGNGAISSWFGILTDIHELHIAEADLARAVVSAAESMREADARAHFAERLMDASEDCIKVLTLDARLISMSANGQKALGVDDFADVAGRNWLDFWSADDRIAAERAVEEARSGRVGQFTGLYAVRERDKWWNVTVTPVFDSRGLPDSLLVTSRDVTEQRQAHLELQRSEEKYRVLGEALPGVTWTATPDGLLDYISGSSVGAVAGGAGSLGNGWLDVVHPDDRAEADLNWKAAIAAGENYETEFRVLADDGTYRWKLVRAMPQRGADGAVMRWVGVNIDFEVKHAALERERRIAVTLQEASLPRALPDVANVFLDAFYRPAFAEASIGGDWYDAFVLEDGRVVFTIGDVLGKGLAAAVTMGKIRQTMRAVAAIHPDPCAILNAADQTVRSESSESIDVYATAIAGVYDPVRCEVMLGAAGHPGPALRHPDGRVEELLVPGTILGLRSGKEDPVITVALPPGAVLVFVTDGLLEQTRDIEEGTRRVLAAVAELHISAEASPACRLVERVLNGKPATDDIAVLIAAFK